MLKKCSFACQPSFQGEEEEQHQASGSDKQEEAIALSVDGKTAISLDINGRVLQRGRYFSKLKDDAYDESESNLGWLDQRLNDCLKARGKDTKEPIHLSAEQQEKRYLAEINDLEEKLRSAKENIDSLRFRSAKAFTEKSWLEEFFLLCMADLRRHMQQQQNLSPKQSGGRTALTDPRDSRLTDGKRNMRYNEVLRRLLNSEDIVTLLYEQMFPHRAASLNIKQRSCGHNRHRTLLPFLKHTAQEAENPLPPQKRELEAYLGLC